MNTAELFKKPEFWGKPQGFISTDIYRIPETEFDLAVAADAIAFPIHREAKRYVITVPGLGPVAYSLLAYWYAKNQNANRDAAIFGVRNVSEFLGVRSNIPVEEMTNLPLLQRSMIVKRHGLTLFSPSYFAQVGLFSASIVRALDVATQPEEILSIFILGFKKMAGMSHTQFLKEPIMAL